MKHLVLIAAVLLSVVSVALPVAQWASIPTDTAIQWLAGLTAFALTLCKLAFFPLAWQHLVNRHFLPAAVLSVFAVFLLAISVDATRDLFETQTGQRQTQTVTQTDDYQQLKTEVAQLNQQIESLTQAIAADVDYSFRDRAYTQAEKLESLKKQRDKKRQALSSAATANSSAAHANFGLSLGQSADNNGNALAALSDGPLITAFSIHVGCVVAVLACGVWAPQTPPVTVKPPVKNPAPAAGKTAPKMAPAKNQQPPQNATLDEEQNLLAQRIVRGEFSDTPSVKKIIQGKEITGGHARVKPIFEWLLQNNHIKKEGRGFQLVQSVIV
ncbi:MAG: hypothetical protein ACRBBW_20455 [Cellvibrionaceae bacterium]